MDTTSAIPPGFHGAAARLTAADISRAATALGIAERLVETVAYVEANNHGFLDDGRPQLLFEAHQFHLLTGGQWDASHPNISSPKWDSTLYGAEGAHQYDRLAEAMALNYDAALQAATWGMFQELGGNYRAVGFATVDDFVAAMCAGEGRHIDVFVAHVVHYNLVSALQAQDWMTFARGYNGSGQVNFYAAKLEAAFKAGNFPPVLPAPVPEPPPPPPTLEPPSTPPVDQDPISVVLRPGTQRVFPGVVALDQDNQAIVLTSGALISADPTIALAEVSGPDEQGKYTILIDARAVGRTLITGPGATWEVTVERAALTRIVVDAAKAFTRPIPAAVAMMAMLMLGPPALREHQAVLHPPIEFAALAPAAAPARPPALNSLERLCFEDLSQPAFAIERCLRWAHALLR